MADLFIVKPEPLSEVRVDTHGKDVNHSVVLHLGEHLPVIRILGNQPGDRLADRQTGTNESTFNHLTSQGTNQI